MFGMNSGRKDQKAVKLSPPWIGYARKVYALFGRDPDISISYDDKAVVLELRVQGEDKAKAIANLLPDEKRFDNVALQIRVVPANTTRSTIQDIQIAFRGNPAFKEVVHIGDVFCNPMNYVVFDNKIVQYFDDDLSTVDGSKTTLYKDLAAEVLGTSDGIFYCEEPGDDVIRWP